MPLVSYSLLRLAVLGGCWALLWWAGLNPLVAVVVAALLAWGISYVAMPGLRDAAAGWLAERHARRTAGVPALSARARQDAADEDAWVAAQDAAGPDEAPGEPGGVAPAAPDDDLRPAPDDAVTPGENGGRSGRRGNVLGNGRGSGQSASPSPSSTP